MHNMGLALAKVKTQTRQALLDALCEIGYKGSGFSDVNSEEYLWATAKKKGTNQIWHMSWIW